MQPGSRRIELRGKPKREQGRQLPQRISRLGNDRAIFHKRLIRDTAIPDSRIQSPTNPWTASFHRPDETQRHLGYLDAALRPA
jgi:hypothetical protein